MTNNHALVFAAIKDMDMSVQCHTDADFANDETDRKSVSWYVTTLDSNTMSYGLRKHTTNALSTAKAKDIA
ncbi:hypothetical protein PybrP1_003271 [[Pythium] brassicae (nom. inval.)]|nr:hypothetical protein PybrP1_003271 [[Pythium] brassicae (nom. inval.)]